MPLPTLQKSIDDTVGLPAEIDWSICVRDGAGMELASRNRDSSMNTASVGKLLLLIEIARQYDTGDLTGAELLGRDRELLVADSGLWQYLQVDALSIHDLCVLVAGVSDNLATNALLKHVGFQRLHSLSTALGLSTIALHDYVRDHRTSGGVMTFSTGSAAELSCLMTRMVKKELLSQTVSERLATWLATCMDLSMVASAFGFDPLAHAETDRCFLIRNKTGTDAGVRADVGAIGREGVWLSYAVVANWKADDANLRDTVLSQMNAIGRMLRDVLHPEVR
jgi:beta-lactamase class A